MKLSVVIVNYNVKFFLEQCLYSVRKASEGMEVQVFVVDNSSVDGSVAMVREKFPEVTLIGNKENLGFSKANNQAIRMSSGDYVLLLNPDTVVEDDTFRKVVAFMDEHPDAGGLGVRMIDGKGNFLPESKRGLPTPGVAFYKISGLSRLFPRSRIFGKYHLGYLSESEIHEVDVLSGAFMLVRKSVLDKIGLLDEEFFMYGEDIDLSYRVTRAGYSNYYYPGTRIIHYKGESTKKGSVNYVLVFYQAMVIFARKHFTRKNARLFSFLINLAIYLRAALAIVSRFLSAILMPLLDILLMYGGIYFIKNYWEQEVIFRDGGHYPLSFMAVVVPLYILIWLISNYLTGVYDRPVKISKIFQGISIGTLFILVGYALLPESIRFSRAIILLGATWSFASMIFIRLVLHMAGFKNAQFGTSEDRRFIIVGEHDEAQRVASLLQKSFPKVGFIGLVSVNHQDHRHEDFIGSLNQVKEIIMVYRIDEVIFCSKNLSHQAIMDQMTALQDTRVDYKIAPEESLSIIGSNSINTAGNLYTININAINTPANKRSKRFIDFSLSLLMLPLFPVLMASVARPLGVPRNIVRVLFGCRSWVGYIPGENTGPEHLPHIRKGILNPEDAFMKYPLSNEMKERLNYIYARDYNIRTDLKIMLRGWRLIGRKT